MGAPKASVGLIVLCIVLISVTLVTSQTLNSTRHNDIKNSTFLQRLSTIPWAKQALVAFPRLNEIGDVGLADIQNILNTLTGGNIGATGTVIFIIIMVKTAIFWIIIFLIIYYAIYAKEEKKGGYSGGYEASSSHHQPQPSYGNSRSIATQNLINRASEMAWAGIEAIMAKYEQN